MKIKNDFLENFKNANIFIKLLPKNISAPEVLITKEDCEIEWYKGSGHLSVTIEDNKVIYAFLAGKIKESGEPIWNNMMPIEVIDILLKYFKENKNEK